MASESDNGCGVRSAAAASELELTNIKRVEVQLLPTHLNKGQAEEDDALLLALAQSTDPLSFLCCCKLKRLGQSYILRERRDGVTMETKLMIVGPHWIGVLITFGIVLVSTGIFLSQHVATMPWYDTVMTLGLCSMTLYYLFQTTCSDPGIVRSEKKVTLTEDESEVAELEAGNVATMESSMEMQTGDFGPHRRRSRRRFCDICGIEQDRSTDHCDDCGVCVAGYDHHCPWMGKCIV
ncbi:unnamed protein product [Peronospora destructor]|uniref:Palmitoyltransferase n=1 Tax=Peronospora destructor TaxID=86335 RepID=A0AAV0TY29_9STRA|nr:unnamed protein product [Peronospora destructor]